ncbi:hypothetical protein PAENIP36_14480 [Paenibacillus sp. P36]
MLRTNYESEDMAFAGFEHASRFVWNVAEALGGFQYPLSCARFNEAGSIHNSGYGGGSYVCFFGNVKNSWLFDEASLLNIVTITATVTNLVRQLP